MRIAYLDCFAGVAGDMWVAALLDAGLEFRALEAAIDSLRLPGVRIARESVRRAGFAATRFVVTVDAPPVERHLADFVAILDAARDLPAPVRDAAVRTLEYLADAEAAVHGRDRESVHFHEVGGEDTLCDVVGAALGMAELGIERVFASPVEVGDGVVDCDHGRLPVPAPGTLANLVGVPIVRRGFPGERTTPTGAALLRTFVDGYDDPPPFVVRAIGHGAGTRDDPGRPNLLRVTLGDLTGDVLAGRVTDALTELCCSVDTATGEALGWLVGRLLEDGARDAWIVPAVGKKGRPLHVVHALVDAAARRAVIDRMLEESTSLGVREHPVGREILPRRSERVDTPLGPVAVKVATLPSGVELRRAEADDVARLAADHGLGRAEVLRRLAALGITGP